MKHKVSELDGALLDAAVAMAEGWTQWKEYGLYAGLPVWQTGNKRAPTMAMFRPSTEWQDGGPIIEREAIAIYRYSNPKEWTAGFDLQVGDGPGVYMEYQEHGPTPLIAAMRAFVASKFGDTVDLPE